MINHLTAPWHQGLIYAGQQLEWLPTDTRECYELKIKDPDNQKYFKKMGWDQPGAIIYEINQHGFRGKEFNQIGHNVLFALGCSFTLGTGLPYNTIWPTVLGNKLNFDVANLGWFGNSADTCFRLAEYWIPKLKPKVVAMLAPPRSRIELLTATSVEDKYCPAEVFGPWQMSDFLSHDTFLNHWFMNEENQRINQIKNCLAIRQLCVEHNIPFLLQKFEDQNWGRFEYSRDFMHSGPGAHANIAEKMYNDFIKITS